MIQIKTADREPWHDCHVDYIAFGKNTYVRFSTKNQHITVYGTIEEIRALLKMLGHKAFHPPVAEWTKSRTAVLDLTPQDVIAYFRSSAVLSYLAEEVEKVLMNLDEVQTSQVSDLDRVTSVLDPSELINEQGLVWGAQAKIAKVLEVPNAGAHRKRILAVVRQLEAKFATTTPKAA